MKFAITLALLVTIALTMAEDAEMDGKCRKSLQPSHWCDASNKDLTLQEVEFIGGTVGTSSRHSSSASWAPENAFTQGTLYWHSGKDAAGNVAGQAFPHLIWYDFRTAFVPGRVSFRARMGDGCGNNGFWCGATKWQFIGTNDEKCDRFSKWTVFCQDLSGLPYERYGQSKYCSVSEKQKKAYRCLGISVLDSSYNGVSEVSLGGIKMWKKILQE